MRREKRIRTLKFFITISITISVIALVTTLFVVFFPIDMSLAIKAVIITIIDLIIAIIGFVIAYQFLRARTIEEKLADERYRAILTSDDMFTTENKQKSTTLKVYSGDLTDKKCQICKMTFEKSDVATQCPKCSTLYHLDHLIQWLMEHKECPVCGTKLSYNEVNL